MTTIHYKNHIITIMQDTDPINPRTDFDHFGTMLCYHRRYNLGDKTKISQDEAQDIAKDKKILSAPLYLYDHSGLSISMQPFNAQFDSGVIGIIYANHAKILSEYKQKKINKKLIKTVLNIFESEVKEYNQYLTGEVYGYKIEGYEVTSDDGHLSDNTTDIDTCFGFYGYDYCLKSAKEQVDYYTERLTKTA